MAQGVKRTMAKSIGVLSSILSSQLVLAIVGTILVTYYSKRYLKNRVSWEHLSVVKVAKMLLVCESIRQASWMPINYVAAQ